MRIPVIPRLFILGVILVFFAGCAMLNNLNAPKYGELVLEYEGGFTTTYVLPPEFPELNQEDLEFNFITFYIAIARCEIGEDIYGIFIWTPDAVALGCGMIVNGKDEYWIYDAQGIPQPCTDDELNAVLEQWNHAEGPLVEPEKKSI